MWSRKDLNGALLLAASAMDVFSSSSPGWKKRYRHTDTITNESPDSLSVTPAEIDYLLEGLTAT